MAAEPVAQAFSTRVAGLKRKSGCGIEREGGRKGLLLEAAEIADIDRIDVLEGDAGIARPPHARRAGDQALERLRLELAKFANAPNR